MGTGDHAHRDVMRPERSGGSADIIGPGTRVLVTVAHPDDESFGMGSVIAAATAEGAEVVVCCATRGEAGEAPASVPGADLGSVREAELRAAADVLGVSRVALLGYADSGMSGPAAAGSLADAPLSQVEADLRRLIAEVDPHVVVTLDPEHGDGHRDHVVIGRATIAAMRDRPGVPVYVWALARRLLARWFAELAEVRLDSGHLDLDQQGLGRPEDEISTVLDVAHVLPVRERAMAAHASQTSPYAGMPADLRDEFLRTDRLVRVRPPWAGPVVERSLTSRR